MSGLIQLRVGQVTVAVVTHPALSAVASCPGSLRGGKLSLVHTVRACAKIYGKESVNVSVNELGHVVRSSTEQHACIVSGRTRNELILPFSNLRKL